MEIENKATNKPVKTLVCFTAVLGRRREGLHQFLNNTSFKSGGLCFV